MAHGQGRTPANFIPDDDIIVVPIQYESRFIDRVMDPSKSQKLAETKTQLDFWYEQEQYVEKWGLEGTGMITVADGDQKLRYFQRQFFRYLGKSAGDPMKEDLKEWWQEWRAEDEVQAIREREAETDSKEQTKVAKKINKDKVINSGPKYKLRFKPRVFKGFVSIQFTSKWFNADAVAGINGRNEVTFNRFFKDVGVYSMASYNFQNQIFLAYVDKRITDKFTVAYTYHDNPDLGPEVDHRLSFRFAMPF